MHFSSDRLPSRHSMENLHQSMRRPLQRTANYLRPSQFLRPLNVRKAPGFDRIPTHLLVILKDEIVHCNSVHHIFTLRVTSRTLPFGWKSVTVTPIYKERGNRQVATNYRPISLLSVLSKCLEKLVFKTLYSHLDQFLPIHQSGFQSLDFKVWISPERLHRMIPARSTDHGAQACHCHTKPAPTALEVQEAGPSSEWTTHLRCRVSIHGHWGAGYLAWLPGLSS